MKLCPPNTVARPTALTLLAPTPRDPCGVSVYDLLLLYPSVASTTPMHNGQAPGSAQRSGGLGSLCLCSLLLSHSQPQPVGWAERREQRERGEERAAVAAGRPVCASTHSACGSTPSVRQHHTSCGSSPTVRSTTRCGSSPQCVAHRMRYAHAMHTRAVARPQCGSTTPAAVAAHTVRSTSYHQDILSHSPLIILP